MKAQNLFFTLVAVLLLSIGNATFADDDMAMDTSGTPVSVNINTDSAEMIAESLSGVGLSRAKAIVQYREDFGPFYSAEELTAVKGIGKGTVAKNEGRIVIN